MARPADAVADGLAADEVGRLERPELLEDAGPAGAEALGELIGRARAVEAEAQQELATQGRRTAGRQQALRDGRRADGLGPDGRIGHR